MPRELKKRGRRAEKQRRAQDESADRPVKRLKTSDHDEDQEHFEVTGDAGDDFISFGEVQENRVETQDEPSTGYQNTFYGLLTEDEQEYYANVNNKISADDFESQEDRSAFIEAVYRESAGKEIKLASSQSCSRYLEKIIHLSSQSQLRALFQAFLQDLDYLVQHRFGSHCVETLFTRSATFVQTKSQDSREDVTFEALFLEATKKLRDNIGFLLTERFASHTIRVLLLVLSGEPLADPSAKGMVASRKKESPGTQKQSDETLSTRRKVPRTFSEALSDLTSAAVSVLDATYLRALATQPVGSPVLQVLLRLELTRENESPEQKHTILDRLCPDRDFKDDSDTGKWVSSLVYDSTGAHFVETLVNYLPGKLFKKMYKNLFRDRIGKLAKNEIASYVAMTIFKRVGKDDLKDAIDAILPELSGLVERNRLAVVRTLIEQSARRHVSMMPLRKALTDAYGDEVSHVLPKMLQAERADTGPSQASNVSKDKHAPKANLQGSLLAQTMLETADLCEIVQEGLLALDTDNLINYSRETVASRVVQSALTSSQSQRSFLRNFVPRFYSSLGALAVDAAGSHVVDALWTATTTANAHFMKEKIAAILLKHESLLRESMYGRNVWRNWSMDLFSRRPQEWQAIAKASAGDTSAAEHAPQPVKSAIQLARERHASKGGSSSRTNAEPRQRQTNTAVSVV